MVPQDGPQQEHKQLKPKRHNAKYCPFAIRERIVNALAAGDSRKAIARALRVSNNTVNAVAEQDWQQVANRKARIAAQFECIATKSCDLLAQKLETDGDKLTANQLVPIAGVAVDKLLALRNEPNVIARLDVEHTHTFNIFEAFQQFHNDALHILQAKQVETEEPPPALELPDSAPTTQHPSS